VLVTVQGFGSIWETRQGDGPVSHNRGMPGAFYNTTGIFVNGKFRPRWRMGGKIRFNAVGGFTPDNPRRCLNRVFECKEPEQVSGGWTQILVQRKLRAPDRPDYHIFALTHESVGRIDIQTPAWKAESVQVIAFSENNCCQEALLLMPAYSWVRGELGTFYAEPAASRLWFAELRLARAN
jgi:hypothetical protein